MPLEKSRSYGFTRRNRVYVPEGLRVLYGPFEGHKKGSRWTVVDEYGCAQLEFLQDYNALNPDTVYIENFEIKPETRGKGCGRSLYLKVEHMARDIGARWIQLDSEDEATGFWYKLGFRRTSAVFYFEKVSMTKSIQ